MDLKAKLSELNDRYHELAVQKLHIHEEMKEIKKKISKYETVLKHAQEIEPETPQP